MEKQATVIVVENNRVIDMTTCSEEDAIDLFLDKVDEHLDLESASNKEVQAMVEEGFVEAGEFGINLYWHEE
jgi:hypothetical protein